jgi:hypothetical protein
MNLSYHTFSLAAVSANKVAPRFCPLLQSFATAESAASLIVETVQVALFNAIFHLVVNVSETLAFGLPPPINPFKACTGPVKRSVCHIYILLVIST